MNKKTLRIGVFLILGIIAVMMISLFEYKEVPDVNWTVDYSLDNKDPYGMWAFKKLVENRYGSSRFYRNGIDTNLTEIDSTGNLYILCSNQDYLSYDKLEEIHEFLYKGNDVLLIGNTDDNFFPAEHDQNITYYGWTTELRVTTVDSLQDTFDFQTYYEDFDEPTSVQFEYYDSYILGEIANCESEAFLSLADTAVVYAKIQCDSFVFYHHTAIELFSNMAALQDDYARHFDYVMNYFDPRMVILDQYEWQDNESGQTAEASPLHYILSQPPLRWSYYALMTGFILFLLFRAKRKQAMIPLRPVVKNTSMQYVHTISELYKAEGQQEILLDKMAEVFEYWVRHQHYMQPGDPMYVEKLAKRMNKSIHEIEYFTNIFFPKGMRPKLNEYQVANLHQKLESLYNGK